MDEREPHRNEEPDHSDDPREQEQGTGGYPESTPGGDPGGDDDSDERDTSGAPATSSPEEGDAGQATGNPDAAG